MTRRPILPAVAVLALLGADPMRLRAADISILGKWEIAEAAPGPWTAEGDRAALNAQGKRMLKTVITFANGKVVSRYKAFNCTRSVIYEPNALDPDSIFQGNLPEPNPTAAALRLGFKRGEIQGVDVRCLKAKYTFHFRDANTAMFNLDNIIYTLKRH